jgi:hypothetical protein
VLAGEIADMKQLGVWEPTAVKAQTFKTSIESAIMLLRIDDIVSGISKKAAGGGGGGGGPQVGRRGVEREVQGGEGAEQGRRRRGIRTGRDDRDGEGAAKMGRAAGCGCNLRQ